MSVFPHAPVIQWLVSKFQYHRISRKLTYSRLRVLTRVSWKSSPDYYRSTPLWGTCSKFFLLWCNSPQRAKASSLSRIHDHTQTHHTQQDSSGRVISQTQRPLPDNTQHPQQTGIPAPRGIRNQNPSKGAAADTRLRPRGHWDRHSISQQIITHFSIFNKETSNWDSGER